ncbi:hypothetical protein AC579_6097 [Pseudocercospora musae]|uniref:Uncharacterized protein n=1 Tax=Pseudocercospora musae TaxID=113226 RepID=A0A139I743_9PEZI|nr:hypothetical protein AC579_6097 [Pseudocercospora musae]
MPKSQLTSQGSVIASQECLWDTTDWNAGTLYNGEIHYGHRAIKSEQLIEIEGKMQPLRDHSGNLKEPMDWDLRLLCNLKLIVEIC